MNINFKTKILYSGIVLSLLIVFGFIISGSSGLWFEYKIMEFTTGIRDNNTIVLFWKAITFIGNTGPVIILTTIICLYLIWKKQYKLMAILLFTVLTVFITESIIKMTFKRIRPEQFFLINMLGYSYPSGHSSVSISLWWTLSLFKLNNNENISNILKKICIILPFLIGYSRLALGVHWPTDVLFGWLLGTIGYTWSSYFYKINTKK